jgi:general secretion pathway protein J
MKPQKRIIHKGFTLVEMLIAIAIFAVLSIMAYGGLNTILTTQAVLKTEMQRLREIQRTFLYLGQDLRQVVERHIRDPLAPAQQLNALITDNLYASKPFKLELTRTGYPNPLVLQRSHLQRVAYYVKDDNLYRYTWPVLDRAQDTLPHISRLCKNINDIRFLFYPRIKKQKSNNLSASTTPEPSTSWPPTNRTQQSASFLPAYIAVTIDFEDWGEVTRLYALSTP